MSTVFKEADHPSPAVLMSPLLINNDVTCLILSFRCNSSYVHLQLGIKENDTSTDDMQLLKEAAFGDPWINDGGLENATQETDIRTTLPKGTYHVVFRTFGKGGYVKLKSITEREGVCDALSLNGRSLENSELLWKCNDCMCVIINRPTIVNLMTVDVCYMTSVNAFNVHTCYVILVKFIIVHVCYTSVIYDGVSSCCVLYRAFNVISSTCH